MTVPSIRSQKGFSLIELMVGAVVSLIIALAVTTFVISLMRANSTTVRTTRVTQDLRMSSELIAKELRRSGYNQNAIQMITNADAYASTFDNMVWGDTQDAQAGDCPATINQGEGSSCLLFSYDRLGINDGTASLEPAGEEWKGFRRVEVGAGRLARGVLQMYVGEDGTEPDCDDAVDASGWHNLTPPGIDITRFALSNATSDPLDLASVPNTTVAVRRVGVQIDARPLQNAGLGEEYTRQVCEEVRVRADEVTYTPPAATP